jgi:hypothetical protein
VTDSLCGPKYRIRSGLPDSPGCPLVLHQVGDDGGVHEGREFSPDMVWEAGELLAGDVVCLSARSGTPCWTWPSFYASCYGTLAGVQVPAPMMAVLELTSLSKTLWPLGVW